MVDTSEKTPAMLLEALAQFTGSTQWYKHMFGLLYTEGAKYMADECGAHWLLDVVVSWQHRCRRDPMLREFQLWTLRKLPPGSANMAVVECWRDTEDKAFQQLIPYTDFPLDTMKLYVENGVIMLPSER